MEEELAPLALYRSKMAMWGGYLLAQWGVARCVGIGDCNAMQSEAISIRYATSWSWLGLGLGLGLELGSPSPSS